MNELRQRLERWLDHRPARRRRAALLAGAVATSVLLGICSRMEAPWFALLFVALVPWLLALDRATSLREAALAGAAMALGFVAAVFPWFPAAMQRYAGASGPAMWLIFLLLAPALEPQLVAFAVARHLARRAGGRGAALVAAAAPAMLYVGVELLYPKLFFDTLGLGLYPSLHLRQGADLAGVHGLSLLVLLINECAALAVRRWLAAARREPAERLQRVLLPLAGALAAVLGLAAYGAARLSGLKAVAAAPGRVIGLVQANITNYDKLRAEQGAFETVRMILDTHRTLSEEILGRASPELIVWPETVYPTLFGAPRSADHAAFDEEIASVAVKSGVPLVFGAYDAEGGREYNAAFFLNPAGQKPSWESYRKRMLFPLTEWVPPALDSEWLRSTLPWAGRWERGPGPRVIEVPLRSGERASVVPLICYDVLFPGFVAGAARMGADLIVTLSNDSWFPDERAPRLHLVSAAFRSIETRLPQVRATNSGISAMIAPDGEVLAATPWTERATLAAELRWAGRKVTPAMVLGPWLGPSLLALGLVLLASVARRQPAPPAKEAEEQAPPAAPVAEEKKPAAQAKKKRNTRKPGMRTK